MNNFFILPLCHNKQHRCYRITPTVVLQLNSIHTIQHSEQNILERNQVPRCPFCNWSPILCWTEQGISMFWSLNMESVVSEARLLVPLTRIVRSWQTLSRHHHSVCHTRPWETAITRFDIVTIISICIIIIIIGVIIIIITLISSSLPYHRHINVTMSCQSQRIYHLKLNQRSSLSSLAPSLSCHQVPDYLSKYITPTWFMSE